jgi:Sec7-like guanine-nucleotide exchange factor
MLNEFKLGLKLSFFVTYYSKDFNIGVLKAFVNLHEFSDMILVQALRWVTGYLNHLVIQPFQSPF